jgi:hypothetical protein
MSHGSGIDCVRIFLQMLFRGQLFDRLTYCANWTVDLLACIDPSSFRVYADFLLWREFGTKALLAATKPITLPLTILRYSATRGCRHDYAKNVSPVEYQKRYLNWLQAVWKGQAVSPKIGAREILIRSERLCRCSNVKCE